MQKLVLSAMCASLFICFTGRAALADKIFGTEFTKRYVTKDTPEEWQKAVKKAKCYLCHVKGKRKELCNTYGDALSRFLDPKKYEKDRCKNEPDAVAQEIQTALEKVEAEKSPRGVTYGELFKSRELPPPKLGALSEQKEATLGSDPGGDDDEDEDED